VGTAPARDARIERERQLCAARDEARRALAEFGVTRPDQIDLDAIAAAQGVEIIYEDLDGATARVMKIGSLARIVVSSRIHDIGAVRFSIAHELGHLRLRHEIPRTAADQVMERVCSPLRANRRKAEREASVYATEQLMPEALVMPWCAADRVTLVPAREIAGEFTTSVLASAMRLVELSPHRCAVVYSELGRVSWIKPSATFPDWIPRGRRLDPATAAYDYFQRGRLDGEPNVVPADAWLPSKKVDRAGMTIVEHSAIVPERGAVYSMLWVPDSRA